MPTYYIDPVNGSDAYAGDSFAAGHPWKTWKHTFAAGDTVLIAKSVETAQAGTVTATNGSVTVNTTNDLTGVCPANTVIRIGTDTMLYLVKSITASAITLYRPYRGTTGSGKAISTLASATQVSGDLVVTGGNGASGNLIQIKGGINTSTLVQDGFTCYNGAWNGTVYGFTVGTFYQLSNILFNGFYRTFYGVLTDCILDNIHVFRAATQFANNFWTRCTFNGLYTELGLFGGTSWGCYNVVINDLDTADSGSYGIYINSFQLGLTINRWRNAGYSGKAAFYLMSNMVNVRIIDAVFDELASGCINFELNSSTILICHDVVFQNPVIGSGTFFNYDAANRSFQGQISFCHVNKSATDHRRVIGNELGLNSPATISSDYSTYHSAAPAVKVALRQGTVPLILKHLFPCVGGQAKTISVYFRKNSSYGSATLPILRIRWMTGTTGALVSNVQEVTMADTNDTWLQYSYEVTPGVDGSILVELVFQSANSGAIAWYDDLSDE